MNNYFTYKNIDEAYETDGTSTTIKPYPPERYGMFQYQNIFSQTLFVSTIFIHASYENIDEAHETAGTATAIKPYPPEHSYGMFQYQNIFS